ncbi:hypothetical protein Cni_G06893 [Canna indica]|uniref:Multidrug and toxic compound extrusion protein n=1 Tax=Canna indica TaxID=4628 RepID=A0AAQ3Q578_9LILI|nr:hypothetical protein Cni_G06893 [Canna indica]
MSYCDTDHGGLTEPLVNGKWPSPTQPPPLLHLKPPQVDVTAAVVEAKCILSLASPMALTGLILYSRSLVSMLFLGRLGCLPLAGGSLAIGFANITGYSVLSGLAMGMEPICGQAVGARHPALLGPALHRAVLLLLAASLPIAALWAAMHRFLLLCGQDADISAAAHAFVLASFPDLLLQSFLHPIRIYLRSQSITLPFTYAAAVAALLHLPLNYTTSLIYVFPSSLGFAVSTRVGNELGAGRPDRARRASAVGIACGAVLGLLAFTFAVVVSQAWARMFTSDAAIAAFTAAVLPIVGMCELGNCPQTAGCGVLRGSARPGTGANVNLGAFYGVGMPVAAALAFWPGGMDFSGLWLGMLAAQATCAVMMLVVVGRTDWEQQAERAQRLTGGRLDVDDEDKAVVVVFVVEKDDSKIRLER